MHYFTYLFGNINRGKYYVAFFFIFFLSLVFSQQNEHVVIQWNGYTTHNYKGKSILVPQINNQSIDQGKPVFYWQQKIKSESTQFNLKNVQAQVAPQQDVEYLTKLGIQIDSIFQYESKVTHSRDEVYAVLYLFPYFLKNGILHRVISFDIDWVYAQVQDVIQLKSFASSSVLESGRWFKITVNKDGIYKIDKAFLEGCGISTQGLNPNHINIYGNGDGKLPENNSVKRTDDLAKNAIQIVDGGDGVFNDDDYILFYGWGPSRWYKSAGNQFEQDKNIYSDVSCYFIHIDASDSPLRISSINSSVLPITHSINTYNYFDVHENDITNLVGGGQRWYGELFDSELERVFNFSVPNIVTTEPAFFKVAIATNCRSSSSNTYSYTVNSTNLITANLPSVSYDYISINSLFTLNNPTSSLPFKVKVTRNSPSTLVYLDRIVLNTRRNLVFLGSQFNFRDLNSVGLGNVGKFTLNAFGAQSFLWDITHRHEPKIVQGSLIGNNFEFIIQTDSLREFVASNNSNFYTPIFKQEIVNQNLHALSQADYLIVTPSEFYAQANRLAGLHREEGLSVHVVEVEKIYNEFSSGMLDPTAIRMFTKMFYDRGASAPQTKPKYLLLFGDGTYDPKNRVANNNNFIPTYQFENGENHISALVSDDYYGMLDANEGISSTDMLDLGIGRLLISDVQMAKNQVDKIEHYMKNGSDLFLSSGISCSDHLEKGNTTFGDWRLNYVQITDDEEGGYFITQDTEPQYFGVKTTYPEMNCDKLYTDAFVQNTTAGGQRYPEVNQAIDNRIQRGALVFNYVGHGGEVGFAEERILTVPQIQSWKNINRMNLFVSATCEFTRYDDPSRVSAGEWASLNEEGGAIALMTTTRSVFFGVNTITGQRFFENVFERDANFEPKSFGEIIRLTKNASGSSDNKRSFTLIGDPALKIALPRMKVITDSINGLHPTIDVDTLKALSKVTIKGHLEDYLGNVLTGFNGVLSPSIFDKVKIQNTLGQDDDSPILPFETQRNIVYKGKATVTNGFFEFSFIVPKDINFSYGPGKISYYGANHLFDAAGQDQRFVIGGINPAGIVDTEGPEIELYLNDKNFVSGGLTNQTPHLIAELFDQNGINTVGNGIGHDLMVVIDDNTSKPIVLNEYYTADLDSYQSGKVQFTMPELEKGLHTLTFKAWDINNNSSTKTIQFVVHQKEEMALDHVLNYPNPFTTHTEFFFEHNQICSNLNVQLQIFTVTGRLVKTLFQNVNTEGFRSSGIAWDGKDDNGDQLAKGVYIYQLNVTTPDGEKAEKIEKLYLLK